MKLEPFLPTEKLAHMVAVHEKTFGKKPDRLVIPTPTFTFEGIPVEFQTYPGYASVDLKSMSSFHHHFEGKNRE